jgi:hypothetical protein
MVIKAELESALATLTAKFDSKLDSLQASTDRRFDDETLIPS